MRLSRDVARKFGHYVYIYLDPFEPLDRSVFYVGKGVGNRAFEHLDDLSENRKVRRIREIRRRGKEPIVEILVHGLKDAETALRVEAAVIDLIGVKNLTNNVRGQKSREYGRREARELEALYKQEPVKIRQPAILVRINQLYRYGMPDNELYDATRGVWRVNPERGAKYAFAVFDGIVREVYEIRQWFPAGTTYSSRDPRGLRMPPRGVAHLVRIVHRARGVGVAPARDTEVLAVRLAEDHAAGVEHAGHDGRVDLGRVALERRCPASSSARRRPSRCP